jgi:DNA-binding NarL/FixJ family response regulator
VIRILIADDHRIFREGLARLLSDDSELNVVAMVADCNETINAVRSNDVDLIILDLSMPGPGGVELIPRIKSIRRNVKILVLTMYEDTQMAVHALRAGADAYLTKGEKTLDLAAIIHLVAKGGRYLCPSIAEKVAVGIANGTEPTDVKERLSAREFTVFRMLVEGKRSAVIASELSLSEQTVSAHKAHLMRKLNVHSVSDLVRYAIRQNMTTP